MTHPFRGGRPRTSDVRRSYRLLHRHITALEWWRRQRGLPDQAAALRSVLDALDEMRDGSKSPARGQKLRPKPESPPNLDVRDDSKTPTKKER